MWVYIVQDSAQADEWVYVTQNGAEADDWESRVCR